MNILILTPDGVGSTILQRLLTMTLHLESVKVINTHELTNGLILKNGVVSKGVGLKYSQTLSDISKLLNVSNKDTRIISRLAKYHMDARLDNLQYQKVFFNFLNTFFKKKIICIRNNVFEYALSWGIRERSGILNIYDRKDKKTVMSVSTVDEDYFLKKCNEYVNYIYWAQDNFPDAEQISYEDIITNSDLIIEKITGYKDTFNKKFGAKLNLLLKMEYEYLNSLTFKDYKRFSYTKENKKALARYKIAANDLCKKNIVIGHPIKNTTLADKRKLIKNFDRCLDKFHKFAKNHNWIDQRLTNYDFWNQEIIC